MEEIKKILETEGKKLFGNIFILQNFWGNMGVSGLKNNTMPLKFSKGILYIAVKHPVWKNEILMNKDIIIKKIKKATNIDVKNIVVEVTRSLPRKGGKEDERILSAKVREPLSEEDLLFILDHVDNQEIKKRVCRLIEKIQRRRSR